MKHLISRSSHRKRSIKKVFLKISQNSQENTGARVFFFDKVAGGASGRLLLDLFGKMLYDHGLTE